MLLNPLEQLLPLLNGCQQGQADSACRRQFHQTFRLVAPRIGGKRRSKRINLLHAVLIVLLNVLPNLPLRKVRLIRALIEQNQLFAALLAWHIFPGERLQIRLDLLDGFRPLFRRHQRFQCPVMRIRHIPMRMPEADDILLRSVQLLHRFFTLIQQIHHRASTAFLRIRLPFGNFLVQQRKIPLMNRFVPRIRKQERQRRGEIRHRLPRPECSGEPLVHCCLLGGCCDGKNPHPCIAASVFDILLFKNFIGGFKHHCRVANEFKRQHRMFRRQQISQFRVQQLQQFLNG